MKKKKLLGALKDLTEAPSIRFDENGRQVAKLENEWVEIERIQEVVGKEGWLEELQESDVPLEWLTLYPEQQRSDIPEDAEKISVAVKNLSKPFLAVANTIAEQFTAALRARGLEIEGIAGVPFVDRVMRSIGGTSQFIVDTLPRHLRRKGEAAYRMEQTDDGLVGSWAEDDDEGLNLSATVVESAGLLGEFDHDAGAVLAEIISNALIDGNEGDMVLPNMRLIKKTESTLVLVWSRADIEAELKNVDGDERK